MKKNVASQKVGAQMITASDGTAFTGSVTVYVTGDAGTQAAGSVGSGACTHEGNGYHTYAPAQAETNYDLIAFTFVGTGAIPTTIQIYSRPTTGILAPTVADRTLDVSATGEAGLDWANIGGKTTSNALTGTTIATSQAVASVTALSTSAIATGVWQTAVAGNFTVANSIGKCLYIANIAPGASGGHFIAGSNAATTVDITGNITGNVSGSVGSVTGAVGSVTGHTPQTGDSYARIGATGSGLTSLASASDQTAIKTKTDYLPSATAGAAGGVFIAGTNAATTVDITGNLSGSVGSVTGAVGSVTGNVGGNVAGSVASVTGAVGSVTSGVTVAAISADVITATSIASGAITNAKFASGAIDAAAIAADAIGASELATDAVTEIVTAVWANTTRILTAGTNIVLAKGTGLIGLNDIAATEIVSNGEITTSYGAVSVVSSLSGHTPQSGDSFARIGATGSGLTSLASASNLSSVKTKTDYLPSATAGAAGGVFIAGSNAATTVDVTGSLSGSVGSVTGAVGSVTGNVGGNVVGSVGSVTGAVGSVSGHTPQTGDSFARIGATGSGLTSLASASNQTAIKTKTDYLPSATAGSSGGVFIAGSNAATTVDITGSLSGSVGSVSGAVGSVTGGVVVTTNNDKTGYALSAAGVDAIWDEAVAGHTTAGTYGASLILVGVSYTYTNDITSETEDVTIT